MSAAALTLARVAVAVESNTPTALARFLTGKSDIDERIVARAFAALRGLEPTFSNRAEGLWRDIKSAGLADVAAFVRSTVNGDADHRKTATEIVSSLYLGTTGAGAKLRLVSYEKALMYAPTHDVTPIPSYARGGPNYWGSLDRAVPGGRDDP